MSPEDQNHSAPGNERGDDETVSQASVDRRAALKKAGVAAATAGAVWVAPSIDGLSLVPDYAAAGTATTSQIQFHWNSDGPGLAAGSNHFHPESSPSYTITQGGSPPGGQMQYVAPLGPAGNATMNLPSGVAADGNAFSGSVVFSVDPPFNKCSVTGGSFNPVTPAFFGDLPGGNLSIGANTVPNNSASITVPFTMPARPGNSTRVNGVTVNIKCD